jgi:hypothetical protein
MEAASFYGVYKKDTADSLTRVLRRGTPKNLGENFF